jgi:glutamate:Na+ symporter, ESS family
MHYFLLVLLLLGVSVIAGKYIPFLHRYRIPPSLPIGLILLIVFSLLPEMKTGGFYLHLHSLPGEFIALLFACLFLQRAEKTHVPVKRLGPVLAQTSLVWVAVMGQVLLGLIGTILIYKPFFGEPLAFTSVLEAGFAGGHGTAVALGPILAQNGIPAGLEYGLFSATIGIIFGISGGLWLIHREGRRTASVRTLDKEEKEVAEFDLSSLMITLALIAAAYWLGQLFKGTVEHEILPRLVAPEQLGKFGLPLFAYTLVGGLTVRTLSHMSGLEHLIDNRSIMLMADVFLEILVFAGIAIINLKLIGHSLIPLLSLFVAGFAWNIFCFIYLRPRMLPISYSFEIGLVNFGMLNGTAAIGLMLLKMVDPGFKTQAARTFAESSAITQPFIAGGLLTILTPFIVSSLAPWLSVLLYGGLLAFWLIFGLATARQLRKHHPQHERS